MAAVGSDQDVKRMSLAFRDLTSLNDHLKKKVIQKGVEILDLSGNHFLYPFNL